MKRVKKSTTILHMLNIETQPNSWDGLIRAAETEIERIRQRAVQLRKAVGVFRRKKMAGEPISAPQSVEHNSNRATHN